MSHTRPRTVRKSSFRSWHDGERAGELGQTVGTRSRLCLERLEDRTLLSVGDLLSQTIPVATPPLETFPTSGSTLFTPSSTVQGYSPAQIRQAYDLNSITFANAVVGDGTGQTIAIIVAYQQLNIASDLHAFDQQFGLADPTLTVATPQGTPADAPVGDWGIEASLDVEWAHALAPGASILLVEARSAGTDLYAAIDFARQQPGVSVVSMSWGSAEFTGETSYDQYFTTPAGHTGITFVAATGDNGAPGDYPAFSPNVLAVGGTMFSATLDAQGDYPGETGWSGSGGGLSQYESQPSYQQGVVTQSTTARATPDVSFDANSGVAVYDSYDFSAATPWISEAGTSLAAPAWAALLATADQGTSLAGHGTLDGHAGDTTIYNLFAATSSLSFNDITTGNNGFAANSGYDLVTGLGTPNAGPLLAGLSGNLVAPTPIGPSGSLTTTLPTFQWSAVSGAAGYHLMAVDLGTNATALDVNVTNGTSYTPSSSTFVPGDNYQWQVQANPILAGLGTFSTPVSFSIAPIIAPNSISPGNTSGVTTTTPTFSWTATPGAVYYSLTVLDESQQNAVAISAPQVMGTSFTPTTPLLAGHFYQWSVQAYVLFSGILYPSQNVASFTFGVTPAGATTLLSPGPSATVTTQTPTFQWSPVTGATEFQFNLFDITSNTTLIDLFVFGTSFTPSVPLNNGHTYQWSVQVIGVTEIPTDEFQVSLPSGGSTSIAAPVLSGPSEFSSTTEPTFQWSQVTGATGYGLYIFSGSAGGSPFAPVNIPGGTSTSYALPTLTPLFDGSTYLWRVVAYDASGDVSAQSTALTFNVYDPEQRVGGAPRGLRRAAQKPHTHPPSNGTLLPGRTY